MAENQVLTSSSEEKEFSELLQIRRDKLSALVEAGKNPFELTSYPVDAYAQDVKAQFKDGEEKTVRIAGRMIWALKALFSALRREKSPFTQQLSFCSQNPCCHCPKSFTG